MQDNTRYRISVNRSNKFITAQVIDDTQGKTLASVTSNETTKEKNKTKQAKLAADILGKKVAELGLKKFKLDRHNYRYHGRVKLFAETLREHKLEF